MDQLLEKLFEDLRGIWLRRFWGLAAAWLVAVAGLAAAFFIPSQYEASARVFVDTASVLKPLMAGLTVQPNIDQQVDILASTLMSRPNVEKLIGLAGLDREAKTEQARNALIERLTRGVELKGSTRDNLFSLSYRDKDPARAKRVVESLLAMFVESGLSTKRRDTDKAMVFLDTQIKQYEADLGAAEQRLKAFKLQNLDRVTSAQDTVGNMLALQDDMEKTRAELRAAEQRRDVLRMQLGGERPMLRPNSTDRASGLPRDADPIADIDARIDLLRRNLDELLRKYTEEHPDVVGTRRVLADLDKQRAVLLEQAQRAGLDGPAPAGARLEYNPVYQQLKVGLADAEGNVAALRGRLSELQARYDRVHEAARLKPEFDQQLAQLNRDYDVQKTNFEQLVKRRESAKMTGDLDQTAGAEFRVIDPPRVSTNPVAPNRFRLLAAALVLSLGAGVASSFLVSRAFPTISTVNELRAVAEMPVLGSIALRPNAGILGRQRRNNYAFAGGVTGLCALFGVGLAALVLAGRLG